MVVFYAMAMVTISVLSSYSLVHTFLLLPGFLVLLL